MERLAPIALALLALWATGAPATAQVQPGIDVLAEREFRELWGKRVGLLTHPAGRSSSGEWTVDILYREPRVNLVALFGPEHGLYGNEAASQPVEDRVDPRTRLPIHSLYGRYRKPTPAMLEGIDVMVVDLQDIGTRSYTFVSCLRLTMEACFEAGIEVVVLDRPNPLGGLKVDGPLIEERWRSYVGAFPVPYVHGLTIGEIARMAKETPGWLDLPARTRQQGRLVIVPMRGWQRSMQWPQTGLPWHPTSPYIPDLSAVLGYAMTGLGGQIGGWRHGIGTPYPFRLLSHRHRSLDEVERAVRSWRLPGLAFRRLRLPNGDEGLYVLVTDWTRLRPTELSFYMMRQAALWSQANPFAAVAGTHQADLFNKHTGSTPWWDEIRKMGPTARVARFIEQWAHQAQAFQQQSRRFWLYE